MKQQERMNFIYPIGNFIKNTKIKYQIDNGRLFREICLAPGSSLID